MLIYVGDQLEAKWKNKTKHRAQKHIQKAKETSIFHSKKPGNQRQMSNQPNKVHFHCQKCKLPLSIDSSLSNLTKAQTHLLTSGRLGYGRDKANAEAVELGEDPYIPKERLQLLEKVSNNTQAKTNSYDSSGSFVILPQFEGQYDDEGDDHNDNGYNGNDDSNKVLSTRLKSLATIFNILSSKSDIDYPVCKDCAQLLLNGLKSQYDKTARERDVYIQFLQKLENKQGPFLSKAEDSIKEVDRLRDQEQELLKELKELELENDDLDEEMLRVQKELEELEVEEDQLFKQQNKIDLEIEKFKNERDAVKAEYEFNLRQLERLRKTNVYNDTFNISHDGPFGTINGLRLGSIESVRVPWQEINAALGQLVLLLATISTRLNIKLVGYRLKPMGSTSRIEKLERDLSNPSNPNKVTVLEVFSSGDYQIERLFTRSSLDNGMIALLDVLTQIADKLKEYDDSIELPYKMVKDKIGDASIRLSSKTADVEWTGACKFLLTK